VSPEQRRANAKKVAARAVGEAQGALTSSWP
jgi:hypothetical protein